MELSILFYLFAGLILMSAFMVIWAQNPVTSVLFLVLVFCNAAGLLLVLEVEFMAMIFLVVYVGAIAVLFLFVIMMLAPKITKERGAVAVGLVLGAILVVIGVSTGREENAGTTLVKIMDNNSVTNIESIGQVLYTHYVFYFIMAGIVLLIAMIGAIVLTQHKAEAQGVCIPREPAVFVIQR